MRNRKILLLAAASAFALMTTSANATYRCTWSDDVKYCGHELGFAPSVGGQSDSRDQHSGDHGSSTGGGGTSSSAVAPAPAVAPVATPTPIAVALKALVKVRPRVAVVLEVSELKRAQKVRDTRSNSRAAIG